MTIDLEQKIRDRAYQIWEQEGRIHGRAEQHWHMAQFELASAAEIAAAEAPAAPAKKSRRASTPAAGAPVPAAAPRRRRAPATLQ